MSASSLSALVQTLQASAVLAGVSVSYGGEMLAGLDRVPPLVDIVPIGGQWEANFYTAGGDPDVPVWGTHEQVDFYCYGFDAVTLNATAVNHADSARAVCNLVMEAVNAQAATGLRCWPMDGQWVAAQNELSQYGRAYKLSINVDVGMQGVLPTYAPNPITTVLTPTI